MQFFKWFEEFFSKTMNVFNGQEDKKKAASSAPNEKSIDIEVIIEKQQVCEVESKNDESSESVVSCSEDTEVDNPQCNLACLLCKQKGEFTVTGRLIPFKLNMYVHTSCALWTNDVFDIDDG